MEVDQDKIADCISEIMSIVAKRKLSGAEYNLLILFLFGENISRINEAGMTAYIHRLLR